MTSIPFIIINITGIHRIFVNVPNFKLKVAIDFKPFVLTLDVNLVKHVDIGVQLN
jgi:hypothetical protein